VVPKVFRQLPWSASAQSILGFVWIAAGLGKVVEPRVMLEAVRLHGIVEGVEPAWIVALGACEIVLGTLLVSLGRVPRARCTILGASALVLGAFTMYLTAVPSEVIRKSGCGCSVIAPVETGSPLVPLIRNALLLVFHAVALRRDPERRSIAPAATSPITPSCA
jgi:hypothetical protein